MDGTHTLDACYEVTEATLRNLYNEMYEQNVLLEGSILKASMVIAGKDCPQHADVDEVARATVECLLNTVPAAVAGVVFLSGGQGNEEATAHLDAMNRLGDFPWPLSFSYGRALQAPALALWGEDTENNIETAQQVLAHRARMNGLASKGEYEASFENS